MTIFSCQFLISFQRVRVHYSDVGWKFSCLEIVCRDPRNGSCYKRRFIVPLIDSRSVGAYVGSLTAQIRETLLQFNRERCRSIYGTKWEEHEAESLDTDREGLLKAHELHQVLTTFVETYKKELVS